MKYAHILDGTTESIRGSRAFFRQSEICQFNMTFVIEQNVFGFQVSVDDAFRMQMSDSQTDFSNVETVINR